MLKSFKYAFSGIISAVKYERNFRFHIVLTIYALWLSRFYDFTKIEYSILFIAISFVLVSELFNTSIEETVDLVSPLYNEKAKRSKDVAAGAVLISALCAIAVGIMLFLNSRVIIKIYKYFASSIVKLFILVISVVLSIFFIFFLFKTKKSNCHSINREKQ